jgi:hypothetical protein
MHSLEPAVELSAEPQPLRRDRPPLTMRQQQPLLEKDDAHKRWDFAGVCVSQLISLANGILYPENSLGLRAAVGYLIPGRDHRNHPLTVVVMVQGSRPSLRYCQV